MTYYFLNLKMGGGEFEGRNAMRLVIAMQPRFVYWCATFFLREWLVFVGCFTPQQLDTYETQVKIVPNIVIFLR